MSIYGITKMPRRLNRLRQVVQVLVRHGFGHVVRRMDLQKYVPMVKRFYELPSDSQPETIARRIVLVLEELGPTFIKLGQILSTRPDILPEEFIVELRKLQNDVKPFDSAIAKRIVENELDSPISENFSYFDDEPFASGSIAQVYRATLVDGSNVVVKVKRPDIQRVIMSDIDLLSKWIVEPAERVPELKPFRPRMLLEELSRTIQRELDFVTEASYTAKFRENFEDNPDIRIPEVYWEFTTPSVLTIERIEGTNLGDITEGEQPGIDRKKIARDLGSAFMEQFFQVGMFHADPHPGNLFLCGNGKIGIVDFGEVGHLTTDLKDHLGTALIAIVRKDVDIITDVFSDIGIYSNETDISNLKPDIVELLDKYYGMPIKKIELRSVFSDITRIARQNGIILPREFVLLGKSLVTIVGLARTLDPEFDLAGVVDPHLKRLVRGKFSPERLAHTAGINLWHLSNLIHEMPREIRQLMKKTLSGSLQVVFKHEGLDDLITNVDRSSNRLAFSIIVASIVVGSSLIMHAKIPPLISQDLSLIGLVGFAVAFVLGIMLLIGIHRSGRL